MTPHRCAWAAKMVVTIAVASAPALAQGQDQKSDAEACATVSPSSIEACTRLIEAESRESALRQATALTFRGLGWKLRSAMENAFADFSAAIKIAPDFGPAYQERGDLLRDNQQCDEALADYDQAIRLSPKTPA